MAIESIMYMGIGFLLAALIAVLAIPLVHSRAERLTIRRLEASLPQSLAEVQADKDLLRADHAISTRRLELKIEHLTVSLAGRLVELGKKQDAVNRLRIQRDALNLEVTALKTQSERSACSTKLTDQANVVPPIPTTSNPIQEVLFTRGTSEGRSTQADTWMRDESNNDFPKPDHATQEDTWTRDKSEGDPPILSRAGQLPTWPRRESVGDIPPILTLSNFRRSKREDTWVRHEDDAPEAATVVPLSAADKCTDESEGPVPRLLDKQTRTGGSLRGARSSHVSAN
jgi:hypothetical protein